MKRSPLRRISKKRQEELKLYSAIKKRLLKECGYVCGVCKKEKKSLDIHHIKNVGSGGGFLDEDNMLVTCRSCHNRIHREPIWAREKGYLI